MLVTLAEQCDHKLVYNSFPTKKTVIEQRKGLFIFFDCKKTRVVFVDYFLSAGGRCQDRIRDPQL